LRHLRPERVIEVGSGFTSALMLDTRDRFLDYRPQFTFVEPYSARLEMLLGQRDREDSRVIRRMVQDVPLEVFQSLAAGDVLFVDSSHVSKVASDLNHLVFEVLPALSPGVVVHFHDVYWPFEYPRRWIMSFRWSWNEAYLLRAFLQYNDCFEIMLFNSYAEHKFPELLQARMPRLLREPGASLWLRKV